MTGSTALNALTAVLTQVGGLDIVSIKVQRNRGITLTVDDAHARRWLVRQFGLGRGVPAGDRRFCHTGVWADVTIRVVGTTDAADHGPWAVAV